MRCERFPNTFPAETDHGQNHLSNSQKLRLSQTKMSSRRQKKKKSLKNVARENNLDPVKIKLTGEFENVTNKRLQVWGVSGKPLWRCVLSSKTSVWNLIASHSDQYSIYAAHLHLSAGWGIHNEVRLATGVKRSLCDSGQVLHKCTECAFDLVQAVHFPPTTEKKWVTKTSNRLRRERLRKTALQMAGGLHCAVTQHDCVEV